MSMLQDIKDQVAREYRMKNFRALLRSIHPTRIESVVDRVGRLYATAVAEDALKRAAERAQTTSSCDNWNCQGESVNKQSILSTPINTDL